MEISFCSLPEDLALPPKWQSFLTEVLTAGAKMEKISEAKELEVVLTNDEEIHRLNREYRQKDQPTDVLSFAWSESDTAFPGEEDLLGQIIISVETAERQAEEYGHTLERELAFLAVHGLLHLSGYDHELGPEEEKIMRAREEEILKSLNISRVKEGFQ